jgi:hypothetical protein
LGCTTHIVGTFVGLGELLDAGAGLSAAEVVGSNTLAVLGAAQSLVEVGGGRLQAGGLGSGECQACHAGEEESNGEDRDTSHLDYC